LEGIISGKDVDIQENDAAISKLKSQIEEITQGKNDTLEK